MDAARDMAELARMINHMGISAGGARNMVSLDSRELVELARRNTGVTEFLDDAWPDSHEEMLRYLDADDSLHTLGRLILRSGMLRVLSNRLMVSEAIRKTPDILDQPIRSPLFITGMPRSGTSLLFELIALGDRFRPALTWEAVCPAGPPARLGVSDERKFVMESARSANDIYMHIFPGFRAVRDLAWNLPAECFQLMDISFFQRLNGHHEDYRWMDRLEGMAVYRWIKKVLQLLQFRNDNGQCWLLKCPVHLHFLPEIFSVFPDARLVVIHRNPLESMPSLLSFYRFALGSVAEYRMPRPIEEIRNWARGVHRAMLQRRAGLVPENRIADIRYSDLMEHPVETLGRALRSLGEECDVGLQAHIREYLSRKPRNRHGVHAYALRDFGIRETEVEELFRGYVEAYGLHAPG